MNQFRFIKLGQKGNWEEDCLKSGVLKLSFQNAAHEDCNQGKWTKVESALAKIQSYKPTVSIWISELKYFYTEPESVIWITFHKGKMWWCNAKPGVTEIVENGAKVKLRKCTKAGWRCKDLKGKDLNLESISGRVLKTRGYRGTICRFDVPSENYLQRRISGEVDPDVINTQVMLQNLDDQVLNLITKLEQYEFEHLVDLIFARSGWVRDRSLGKTEKTIEATLKNALTGETAHFQAKCSTSSKVYSAWQQEAYAFPQDKKFFFTHTFKGPEPEIVDGFEFVGPKRLAVMVTRMGLTDWVMDKLS